MAKLIDEVGNVYGRLTVLKRAENNNRGQARWLCKCECGNTTVVRGTTLRRGMTKSCGCLVGEKSTENLRAWYAEGHPHPNELPRGVSAMRTLMNNYKWKAQDRGFVWELTETQFEWLTSGLCHYCGTEPKQVCCPPGANGSYIYNGLDRVANDRGYVVDNVVPCCGRCNIAKQDMSMDEFREWVAQVHEHLSVPHTLSLADAMREMA